MSNNLRSIRRKQQQMTAKGSSLSVSLATLLQCAMASPENPVPSLQFLLRADLPIRQSFLIRKIVKAVASEIEEYQAAQKTLCEKYAEKEDGKARILNMAGEVVKEGEQGRYDIPADKMPDFEKEYAELTATEVNIPGARFKLSDLEGVRIPPAYLDSLQWLIEDASTE